MSTMVWSFVWACNLPAFTASVTGRHWEKLMRSFISACSMRKCILLVAGLELGMFLPRGVLEVKFWVSTQRLWRLLQRVKERSSAAADIEFPLVVQTHSQSWSEQIYLCMSVELPSKTQSKTGESRRQDREHCPFVGTIFPNTASQLHRPFLLFTLYSNILTSVAPLSVCPCYFAHSPEDSTTPVHTEQH